MISLERVVSWNWKWHPTLSFRLQSSISLWGKEESEWVVVVVGVGVAASGRTFIWHFSALSQQTNQHAGKPRLCTNHQTSDQPCMHCTCVRACIWFRKRAHTRECERKVPFSLPLATTSTASFHFESNGLTIVARKLVSRLAGFWL